MLLTMARGVWELRESFGPKDANRRAKNRFGDFYDFERVGSFAAPGLPLGRSI